MYCTYAYKCICKSNFLRNFGSFSQKSRDFAPPPAISARF